MAFVPIGPGETFERYTIEALIGRGGMGEVYRAMDTLLRRRVALKVLRPDKERPDAVARLYREARAAAALAHPNAVALHDVGEAEGVFYIVMELVRGQPLLSFVGDDRVPPAKKVGWLVEVARALAAAHRAGIIHRDVKPSNVMVSDEGFAKVLDFGLARTVDGAAVDPISFRTQDGRVLGTLRYMAPEQAVGATADERSDQYAFGLTAYELLSGVHPGGALVEAPPERLSEVAPAVPAAVSSVVMRALARSPSERHASMDDLAQALEDALEARPAPATEAPLLVGQREPTTATAATLAAGSVLAELARTGAREPAGVPNTLVSKEAPSALVRARDLVKAASASKQEPAREAPADRPKTLISATKEPPPAPAPAPASEPDAAAPSTAPAPGGRRTTWIVVTVLLLALAVFAGTYLGSRRTEPPAPANAR